VKAAGDRQGPIGSERLDILGPSQRVRVLTTDHRIDQNIAGERTELAVPAPVA